MHTAGSYMPLTVYWQALDDIPDDYSISLQILREDWSYVDQRDIQNPVMGMYATSRWQAGEVVGDFHEIPIPAYNAAWTLPLDVGRIPIVA